ncbi:MAG: hypothetical protein IJ262_01580 [Clostridia bacterium]|nr:hypothetical protein [Clostridia bacterium]
MGNMLIFAFLLIGLTVSFKKVTEWFQYNKNINIIPAALIEMIAVIVFMFNYGSEYTDDVVLMWLSVVLILAITVFNVVKYGIKDGVLASLAELVFSISSAILVAYILVTGGKKARKKSSYRRK